MSAIELLLKSSEALAQDSVYHAGSTLKRLTGESGSYKKGLPGMVCNHIYDP